MYCESHSLRQQFLTAEKFRPTFPPNTREMLMFRDHSLSRLFSAGHMRLRVRLMQNTGLADLRHALGGADFKRAAAESRTRKHNVGSLVEWLKGALLGWGHRVVGPPPPIFSVPTTSWHACRSRTHAPKAHRANSRARAATRKCRARFGLQRKLSRSPQSARRTSRPCPAGLALNCR